MDRTPPPPRYTPPLAAAYAPPPGLRVAGIVLIVLAASCFSMSTIFGRFAMDGGSDPITVIAGRFYVGVVLLGLIVRWRGARLGIPRRNKLGAIALGCGMTASSLGLFAAIDLIPVSLTVLIFYTFPILVGIATRFTEGEPLTAGKFGALGLAFAGLAIALNVQFDGLDPWGLVFACVPALAIGAITLFGHRVLVGQDSLVMTFYMFATGCVTMTVALVIAGGPAVPATSLGWLGFLGVPLCFVVGNQMFFAAFSRIRSTDIAMTMNTEPVASIAFAALFLGEILAPIQYAGAAMVIAAVVAMTLIRR